MNQKTVSPHFVDLHTRTAAALAAAAFASILVLVQMPVLDLPLKAALACFAVSLPAHMVTILALHPVAPGRKLLFSTTRYFFIQTVPMFIAVFGVLFILMHFHLGYCIAASISFVIAVFLTLSSFKKE